MRWIPTLFLVLTLGVSAVEAGPGPAAPSEAAARSASRNLLRMLRGTPKDDRVDALARYVDIDVCAKQMFGEAADEGSPLDRAILRRLLASFVAVGIFERMPLPEDPSLAKLDTVELPDGRRLIEYEVKDSRVHLIWAGRATASMLVDFGSPSEGMLGATGQMMWKKSGKKPSDFLTGLLRKLAGPVADREGMVKSKDNIRTMLTLLISRRIGRVSGGYPPYSGKAFVLSLVVTRQLDLRKKANLEILFSPADKRHALAKVDFARYQDVTKDSLKKGTSVVTDLTSYAGRRNAEPEHLVTSDQEKVGTPLIADLHFPDMAIVGFSDGSVRVMDRKELGLGPKDPIVAGDASKSELLRQLSDD